jgi:hypothetical protein
MASSTSGCRITRRNRALLVIAIKRGEIDLRDYRRQRGQLLPVFAFDEQGTAPRRDNIGESGEKTVPRSAFEDWRQGSVELAANHLFDELPDAVADPGLDRIEPIVEKLGGRLGQELRGFNLRVVSGPALQRQVIRG